jgi:hypothetical protein
MTKDEGRRLAVKAEALYLANLLALPGLAFVIICVLWRRHGETGTPLARMHLRQTLIASLWAGALLLGLSTAILALGGFTSPWAWMATILYFTVFHSTLVLCGMVGLAHALAGKPFVFPLIGGQRVVVPDEHR